MKSNNLNTKNIKSSDLEKPVNIFQLSDTKIKISKVGASTVVEIL